MKTRYYKKITFLILVGMMIACQDQEIYEASQGYGPINLQAEIIQENVTRANDNGFTDGDKMGVFVVDYNGTVAQPLKATGNHANNVLFSYNGKDGSWKGSTQLYWKDQTTAIDLYGYYPFDGSLQEVSSYQFAVQRNQRDAMADGYMTGYSGYEASDFLWCKAENIYPTTATITLCYHHLFAGIKVSLLPGEGFEEQEWSKVSKTVLIDNTRLDALIDLNNGNVVANDLSKATVIIPQHYNHEYRAIVVPQKVEAGKRLISITVDGKSYEFTRQQTMDYQAGKLHKFTFLVNKKQEGGDYEFKLLDEAITLWENDPLSHNGTARQYITVHVNEGEYIGDVVKQLNIDPKAVRNLKLTGTLSEHDHFRYIREQMPYLEAVHMKNLRTKHQEVYENWDGVNKEEEYGYWTYEDDFIPRSAFQNMAFLSYVVWPDSLKGISRAAFAGTNLRGSLILPEGLKYVGPDCFYAYAHKPNSLSGELYIPSTVEYIGQWAFAECYFNCELVLPQKMKYLGSGAFMNGKYLTGQIQIPEGLTEVNDAWLYTGVTGYATVPQGVKKINGIGCLISGIYLPEGVEEIKQIHTEDVEKFRTNYGVTGMNNFMKHDIHLPSTLKKLNEHSFFYVNSAKINIPEGLEMIPAWSFNGARLQDTLTVPKSVIQIQRGAFADCRFLNAIVLPENLEEIQERAFENCHSLNYIQCLSLVPPVLNASSFNGVEKNNFTVVVPAGSVEAYRNADGWREFKRISTYYNFVCRPMSAKLLNNGNTRTVVLNADGNWKVTHFPKWVHLSATNGYKKTELKVVIDELARGAGNRCDSIVFTLTDKTNDDGNPITACYKITQFDSEYKENSQCTLQTATEGKGINLVFTADGYDAEDIADGSFMADIQEGVKYFFGVEPYKTYKEYFNVYADVALSYESGVCSNVNIWRETKFNTTYGAGKNGRLKIDSDKVLDFVMNDVVNSSLTPENVSQSLVICLLNSDVYEGVCALYGDGSAVAFVPHSRWDYPNDYRGIIQHEAGGHGFGKLADEYIYHRDHIQRCGCPCCVHDGDLLYHQSLGWYRNLSLTGKYSDIEWRHLIFDARYDDIVDIYEGGYFHGRGVYRSEVNSCMNDNVPYYSTISRQAIVERIMDYAGKTFDFETFVSKDSREMGDKYILTRMEGMKSSGKAIRNSAPVFIPGSPMDYIKKRLNEPSK